MAYDFHGLEVTASKSSADSLNKAVVDYFWWRGSPIEYLEKAVAEDPTFSLGSTLSAVMYLHGFKRGDDPAVVGSLARAKAALKGATARELTHYKAAEAWACGKYLDATQLWEKILIEHPRDLFAAKFAHDGYFYLGMSESIRDSIARILPTWDVAQSTYGFGLGAYAFGLEETGDMRKAESVASRAIAFNAQDGWAIHALAHVLETGCRQEEGISFLSRTRQDWSQCEWLATHNGWHVALYLLEIGEVEKVLADYDKYVAPRLPLDSFLDLIDAAALLWRVELIGGNVGDRWEVLAAQIMTHVDDHAFSFNDLHIVFAAARSRNSSHLKQVQESLDKYERDGDGDNHQVYRAVGKALIEGVISFSQGRYREAIDALLPVRHKIISIGGSHAQRDVLTQTLIFAAVRARDVNLSRYLLAERIAIRPTKRTQRQLNGVSAALAGA